MILVTGGAGYIGCLLVKQLLERGKQVRVFDKLYFGKDALKDVENRIELVQGDIRDVEPSVLDGIDGVIHLAGLSNDPTAEYNPKANDEMNHIGTRRLAEACKEKGVKRFVYASSCSIYYTLTPEDTMLDEESPVSPTAPYSKSKFDGENALKALEDDSFCPVILRKGTIFGQSPRMRYDLVVNTFSLHAYLKGRVTVHGGGEMWRPLLDINDAVDAYIACLDAPEDRVKGQIFNVVHKNYRILELAHWLKYILREKKQLEVDVRYLESAPVRSYRVNGDKIKRAIGFEPKRGITPAALAIWEGLEGKTEMDLSHPRYYNIRWMELLVEMEERIKSMGRIF
ncbi:MAG: SDR family oxidoreductase [Firmicutes bacterium]|nr:SDR family oxidoreductase [Bacillota bacterium]